MGDIESFDALWWLREIQFLLKILDEFLFFRSEDLKAGFKGNLGVFFHQKYQVVLFPPFGHH